MRRLTGLIMLALLFGSLPLTVAAEYELNYDNLMLAQLAQGVDEERWPLIASEHLRLWHAGRWQELEKDQSALDAAIREHQRHLQEQANAYREESELVYRKRINFTDYDPQQGGFPLQRVIRNSVYDLANTSSIYATELPIEYRVMLANNDDFDVWPMSAADAEALLESRQSMRRRQRYKLFAEAHIELVKLQHGHQFQALITELRLYNSDNDKKPIQVLKMSDGARERVNSWMLARGVTHPGTPVHQFQYAGYRLNEIVDPYIDAYGECEQRPDRESQSYYLCRSEARVKRVPVRVELDVVGGRVDEARFFRAGEWTSPDLRQILHGLNISMNRTGSVERWYYGPAILEADESAIRGSTEGPYLRITVEDSWSRDQPQRDAHDGT